LHEAAPGLAFPAERLGLECQVTQQDSGARRRIARKQTSAADSLWPSRVATKTTPAAFGRALQLRGFSEA